MKSSVKIRLASLDDVKDIVDIYCSNVDHWVKHINGKEVEVRYDDLSVVERWAHGGPWMSIETCAIHLNYLLLWNQYPIIAIVDNRAVGELELYIGYEENILGYHGFIDVLEVHKDYQGRGIGRRLVEEAIRLAIDSNCDTIAVWPDPKVVEFYRKIGIDRIAYYVKYVRLYLHSVESIGIESIDIKEFPTDFDTIRYWLFISPRIETSFVSWIKNQWDYAIEKNAIKYFSATIPSLGIALAIESLWLNHDEGSLYLWIRELDILPQVLDAILSIAKSLGFKNLRLLVSREIYDRYVSHRYKHEVIGEYIVLFKKLK